ncbi:uncharacterized protein BN456_00156 [Prevotella sp. CAG:1031]|nr:uncharacterized protein BN456_00156 [Prevotella sp. CAG:1031]
MAGFEQGVFIAGFSHFDSAVEEGVDFSGKFVVEGIERTLHVVFVEVECGESLAGIEKFFTDAADGFHVDFHFNAEFLTEDINELDCGSCRAASEPPDVGVENVDAVDDGHQRRCQTIAGGAVGVEVYGNVGGQSCAEFGDNRGGAHRVDQAGHVLEGDYLCAEAVHLFGLVDEVAVGEDFLDFGSGCRLFFFAEEAREETFLLFDGSGCGSFVFRVDGITYGAVGNAAELVNQTDGFLNVVDIVEGIEDTHDVEAVFDGFFVESFENCVGIGDISEEVAAAREGTEQRFAFHCFAEFAKAIPGRFVEVAHY